MNCRLVIAALLAAAAVPPPSRRIVPSTRRRPLHDLVNGQRLSGWVGRQGTYSPYGRHATARAARRQEGRVECDRDKHWRVDTGKGEMCRTARRPSRDREEYATSSCTSNWLMVARTATRASTCAASRRFRSGSRNPRERQRRRQGFGASEQQPEHPGQVPCEGRQSDRPVEHAARADDREQGLDLAHGQQTVNEQVLDISSTSSRCCPKGRSSCRRTGPRSASEHLHPGDHRSVAWFPGSEDPGSIPRWSRAFSGRLAAVFVQARTSSRRMGWSSSSCRTEARGLLGP